MMDCMFKGNKETCIICTYYFTCKAREFQTNHKQDEVKHESSNS